MLNNASLLELYKLEKAALDDPLFGSPFPSFTRWKSKVELESVGLYRDTAIEMEQAVEEIDKLLVEPEISAQPKSIVIKPKPKIVEEITMARKAKSKVDKARAVFEQYFGAIPRSEMLKKFQNKSVGLTPAGASTYYQKFKTETEVS